MRDLTASSVTGFLNSSSSAVAVSDSLGSRLVGPEWLTEDEGLGVLPFELLGTRGPDRGDDC